MINLLDSVCSSFRLTVAGSSSDSSKSSGIGCFFDGVALCVLFVGICIVNIHQIIYNDFDEFKYHLS